MRMLLFFLCLLFNSALVGQTARYQVIIDEIMADPSPQVLALGGLPESEYVELKNISSVTIDLFNWKLGDATGMATIGIHFMLKPDSFVIICASSFSQVFSTMGSTIGVSGFPSLDNGHDVVILKSKEGNTIAAIEYDSDWYGNAVKAQGGWSMEMIDIKNYCGGRANWTASTDKKGGTPGKPNAAAGLNPDIDPPRLLRSYATDSVHLVCVFDEPVDSTAASKPVNYKLSRQGTVIISASLVEPFLNRIRFLISQPIKSNEIIDLTVMNVRDCTGNMIAGSISVKTGLAVYPDTAKLVINELLFNPVTPGVDYVELLNYGNAIVDLKDILLANRTSAGITGSIQPISNENRLLFPGEYCLLTESSQMVARQFIIRNSATMIQLSSFPSYPDETGTVMIINSRGRIMEELTYNEKWHFKLITNREGISLERIDPGKPGHDQSNWHSASGTAGYGTPGYVNSQSGANDAADGIISIQPRVFSPDNDGFDDFIILNYRFPETGYTCNVTVYDLSGKIVRQLARNLLCGVEGYLRWDGLDMVDRKAGSGIYLIVTDVFTLKGKTKRYKNTVVVGS